MTNRTHPVFSPGDLVRVRTRFGPAVRLENIDLDAEINWERGEFDYLGIVCTRVTPRVVAVLRLDDQMSEDPIQCGTAQLELVQRGEQ